ncbi:uncharacterized protein LOC128867651 [Anastrepha ludens]|uniref:uncharacterized protein LOC128867651 n=1 Tax=Anastrepha ludens TaxID=28586 RepID=UPI0023B1EB62|nr:uncharacterized protein LOC128867651 [Anastrepha ludens]
MKPNRKDTVAQVLTKTTTATTIGRTTVDAAVVTVEAETQKHDEQRYGLIENVSLIGWMGIIVSTTILLCTGLTMQWSHEFHRYFAYALRKSFEMELTRVMLRRVIMAINTGVYFLSAVNVLMNMFLLIGVAKLNYKLMLPWLLFHGILFGLFVHVAIYVSISSLLVNCRVFVILLASFTVILMIFYKISYEVFTLCKNLRKDSLAGANKPMLMSDQKNRNGYVVLESEV